MCFWSENAFFNCDGSVSRMKYLCTPAADKHRSGADICKNYENNLGCKHSETDRAIPYQAPYRHVCDKDGYNPPARSGIRHSWKPSINTTKDMFIRAKSGDGSELKNGVQFQWCDGSICTLEEVYSKDAPLFCWGGIDLLELEKDEREALVGKGRYEYWVEVWSGKKE